MQKFCSSNTPVVTGIYDQKQSWKQHHCKERNLTFKFREKIRRKWNKKILFQLLGSYIKYWVKECFSLNQATCEFLEFVMYDALLSKH